MRLPILFALAPLLVTSNVSFAQPAAPSVTEAALMRHIEVLASDAYEGRKPGTAGETKTLNYLTAQFAALGLEPAGENGTWFQAVPLVLRQAFAHRALFTRDGAPVEFAQGDVVLIGRKPVERLADAPVWLLGTGGAEQLAGSDLRGAVVLTTQTSGAEALNAALGKAGAAAVITVLGDDVPWQAVSGAAKRGRERLAREDGLTVQGAMPRAAALRLTGEERLAAAAQPGAGPVRLPVRASLDVSTQVREYRSNNVIARLRGHGRSGEAVMILGHWDHLGLCRADGEVDRICNGAVDNASGMAMIIETARALAAGPRPARDILFMGTTAEEMGLLGAEWFGANPTIPTPKLVAAINVDTVAIAPAGEPVAIVGRGTTPLDPIVDQAARELGRRVDSDTEANAFVQRQDGYALTRAGVPTIMAGGSFADLGKLGAFLSGPYHKHDDDLNRPIELGGAAEDTTLTIALMRKLADPKVYRPAAK